MTHSTQGTHGEEDLRCKFIIVSLRNLLCRSWLPSPSFQWTYSFYHRECRNALRFVGSSCLMIRSVFWQTCCSYLPYPSSSSNTLSVEAKVGLHAQFESVLPHHCPAYKFHVLSFALLLGRSRVVCVQLVRTDVVEKRCPYT